MRARMRRALPALGLLCAGLALLAGCGQVQARPIPSATALPEGVSATLLPAGPAQQPGEVRLWVNNTTAEDLSVTRVRIADPRFLGFGRMRDYGTVLVPPGQQAQLIVVLPHVDCDHSSLATPTPVPEGLEPSPSPSSSASAAPPSDAMLVFGFRVGAATGTTSEAIADPDDVIESYIASQCP